MGIQDFVSNAWQKGIFGIQQQRQYAISTCWLAQPDNKVVFCTGGSGDICSAQVKAL